MTISKDWLQQQMDLASSQKEEMEKTDYPEIHPLICQGMFLAFQICYSELIQPPKPKEEKADTFTVTTFDRDKTFTDIVKYYISKNYSLDHANAIAMKVVKEQEERIKNARPKTS